MMGFFLLPNAICAVFGHKWRNVIWSQSKIPVLWCERCEKVADTKW